MAGVHVVVDSTANVPEEMLRRNANLHVVSLTVSVNGRQYKEQELSCETLFTMIEAGGSFPHTSQPSPGEFQKLFTRLAAENAAVIVITIAGQLSGTVQSARLAAQSLGTDQVAVIDSGTTAVGMVQMAQKALDLAAAGETLPKIAAAVTQLRDATHTLFVPGTLRYLQKGGRIGKAAALLGTILKVNPVLYLRNGQVEVLDKVRTRAKAIERMADEIRTYNKLVRIGVVQLAAQDEAENFCRSLRQEFTDTPVSLSVGGAVLGSHLGPGLLGVIFQTAADDACRMG